MLCQISKSQVKESITLCTFYLYCYLL